MSGSRVRQTNIKMDFSSWTNRLREATGSLPFKGLDEMAAEDDYVHSESLNVKRSTTTSPTNQNFVNEENCVTLSNDMESQRLPLHASSDVGLDHHKHRITRHHSLPVTIDDMLNQDEDDPVHSAMWMEKTKNRMEGPNEMVSGSMGVLEMEESDSYENMDSNASSSSGKSKHRFMEDLDTRLSKTNVPSRSSSVKVMISTTTNTTPHENGGSRNWLFSLVGEAKDRSIPESNGKTTTNPTTTTTTSALPPLSRARIKATKSSSTDERKEQSYTVVTSTNMLDADDLMALEQMKQLNEKQSYSENIVHTIKEMIQTHPREAFIVFTLVVATIVYFYLRRVSSEED